MYKGVNDRNKVMELLIEKNYVIKYPELFYDLLIVLPFEIFNDIYNKYVLGSRNIENKDYLISLLNKYIFDNNIRSIRIDNVNSILEKLDYNGDERILIMYINSLPPNKLETNVISLDVIVGIEDVNKRNKILIALFNRLKELKSNRYDSYLYHLAKLPYIPDEITEILLDEENPLNVNYSSLRQVFGNSVEKDREATIRYFNRLSEVSLEEFKALLSNNDGTKEFFDLLESILLGNKIKDVDGVLAALHENIVNKKSIVHTASLMGEDKSNIVNGLVDVLKKYLVGKKGIKLEISEIAKNADLIRTCTFEGLDDSYFVSDLKYLKCKTKLAYQELFDQIMKRLTDGKKVNAALLYECSSHVTVNFNIFLYDNVIYDWKDISIANMNNIFFNSQETRDRFVREKYIPNINQSYLSYMTVTENFSCLVPQYIKEILAKLNDLFDKDPAMQINDSIFDLYNKYNGKDLDDYILRVMNNICSKFYLNLSSVDSPVFDQYFIKNIIGNNSIETIANNLANINSKLYLRKDSYVEAIEEKIRNEKKVPVTLINQKILKFPSLKDAILQAIDDKKITSIPSVNDEGYLDIDILNALIKFDFNVVSKYVTYIIHYKPIISKEAFDVIYDNVVVYYEFDREKLDLFKELLGDQVLYYIENENFVSLTKKSKEDIIKFLEIFKNRTVNKTMIDAVNESLIQRIFAFQNEDALSVFSQTVLKITSGLSSEDRDSLIEQFKGCIPKKFESLLRSHKDSKLLEMYNIGVEEFLSYLFDCINYNQNDYVSILHYITNEYISGLRNDFFAANSDVTVNTEAYYQLDFKSLSDNFFNYLLNNYFDYLVLVFAADGFLALDFYTPSEDKKDEELEKIKEVLYYLKAPDKFSNLSQDELKDLKKRIGGVRALFREYMEVYRDMMNPLPDYFDFLLHDERFISSIKKYIIIPQSTFRFDDVLKNVNFDVMFNEVFADKEKYDTLVALLNKYSFLNWGNLFNNSLKKLSIDLNDLELFNLFNFINGFNKVYDGEYKIALQARDELVERMKQNGSSQKDIDEVLAKPIVVNITPYKIYKYNALYSSMSNCYKVIMGLEDAMLTKENRGLMAANVPVEQRLEYNLQLQVKMFQNKEITIPSFIKDYEADGEKKLRVIVGNRSDSRNLTHGERTDACMRAHGHAHSLFEFCNTDARGFHITFEDPETHEYVSRVSGFRNGNTVFLNQLRFSESENYTTDEVIKVCREVAKDLIELSKDSSMPIENVVCSTGYALQGSETECLSEPEIREGVGNFYLDVNQNAVIMATIGKDNKPVNVKLDANNQPIYKPVRLIPIEYPKASITEEIVIRMQRITAIKNCLEHFEDLDYYHSIDFDLEMMNKEFSYAIIGEDFYVAMDSYGNVMYDYVPGDERVLDEFNAALDKINSMKSSNKEMGGLSV